jgi:hypothetical protein
MEDIFLNVLKNKFNNLYELANLNNFIILIPNKKLINENMLNQNFYNNHIYSICKYDEQMYINLNGKVLKYYHPKFSSFIGWKKEMTFNIKENFRTDNIILYLIDNVCDDNGYSTTYSKDNNNNNINTNSLIPKESMSEYLQLSPNIEFNNDDYKKVLIDIKNFVYKMKNSIIFMKNFENEYSKYFNEDSNEILKNIKKGLNGMKGNDENNYLTVCNQLCESLIFNDLYSFIMNNLINFYSEDEKELKKKLKENPSRFDWSNLNIDEAFKNCKFNKEIETLNLIKTKKTVFEKANLIYLINENMSKEAKIIYEEKTKKNYNPQADTFLTFWMYILTHSSMENIIAESKFLTLFNFVGNMDEKSYLITTFITAVDGIEKEILVKSEKLMTQKVIPCFINCGD